jgi:hypothetical protein
MSSEEKAKDHLSKKLACLMIKHSRNNYENSKNETDAIFNQIFSITLPDDDEFKQKKKIMMISLTLCHQNQKHQMKWIPLYLIELLEI